MERYIDEAQQLGLHSIFDPGQQIIRMDHDSLRRGTLSAHGLFVNAYEFELLQKHSGLSEAEILDAPEFSVITLGKRVPVFTPMPKICGADHRRSPCS